MVLCNLHRKFQLNSVAHQIEMKKKIIQKVKTFLCEELC